MPIHLKTLDVVDRLQPRSSALIIPCYMCPAVTVAVEENQPFLEVFSHFLKSPPFERYIKALQARLQAHGVSSTVFKSNFVHQWFLCMWTSGRRQKLERSLADYDYAIVLGCDSATETVRDLPGADGREVIQAMAITGFMNARMSLQLPCNVGFENCKVIPLAAQENVGDD